MFSEYLPKIISAVIAVGFFIPFAFVYRFIVRKPSSMLGFNNHLGLKTIVDFIVWAPIIFCGILCAGVAITLPGIDALEGLVNHYILSILHPAGLLIFCGAVLIPIFILNKRSFDKA